MLKQKGEARRKSKNVAWVVDARKMPRLRSGAESFPATGGTSWTGGEGKRGGWGKKNSQRVSQRCGNKREAYQKRGLFE